MRVFFGALLLLCLASTARANTWTSYPAFEYSHYGFASEVKEGELTFTRRLDIRTIDGPFTPRDKFFATQHLGQPKVDPATYMAKHEHPGVSRTSGFFGFAGHNDPVMFRNVQIRKR